MRGKAQATLVLEHAIFDIVEERAPITVRGVCYALFVRGLIESMAVWDTGRISRIMTAMRENETLDWTKIVDGSRAVQRVTLWTDPNEIIRAAVRGYRRNNWQNQAVIVEVWSEKSTVQGVLAPVLDELGVTFRIMKGFGSFTAVKQAAADDSDNVKQATIALYIGDWDPEGPPGTPYASRPVLGMGRRAAFSPKAQCSGRVPKKIHTKSLNEWRRFMG
jgi:hypothetical protein